MAKESQRLERISFPMAGVDMSSLLSMVRHLRGKRAQFIPIHPPFLHGHFSSPSILCKFTQDQCWRALRDAFEQPNPLGARRET
jgi:hypothetical protein